jgi:hypothetical protein
MQEPSHIRALSLVLAFSVVVAGWLLFEYGNHQAEQIVQPNDDQQTAAVPVRQQSQPAPPQVAPSPRTTMPSNLTFKCEKGGHISYGDQPCGEKTTTVAITASEQEPPTKNNLQQLQERLAAMEASRLEREEKIASATVVLSSAPAASTNRSLASACQEIDLAIAAKDSELRQPHSAQWGDYLTGERKKLTDKRFSLGC